jgi:hypothetical protein
VTTTTRKWLGTKVATNKTKKKTKTFRFLLSFIYPAAVKEKVTRNAMVLVVSRPALTFELWEESQVWVMNLIHPCPVLIDAGSTKLAQNRRHSFDEGAYGLLGCTEHTMQIPQEL